MLFWLLDRTGAITDTSLFAAVLIGIGYERIIAGGNQTLRAPGDVSALWEPFLAYADKVAKVVLDRGAQNQLRLAEKIIAEIVDVPERYNALEAFALGRSSDVAALRAALDDIDKAEASGESDKLEKKTRHLYGLVLSIPDVHYLLKNKKIIGDRFYWCHIKRMAQVSQLAVVAILVVGVSVKFGVPYYPDYREVPATYHVWRLGKTNSSSVDQYRSRRRLVALMEHSPTLKEKATDQLIYLVQRPGLPMERVDLVLQTLLESRTRSPNGDLPRKLVQALRSGGLDARTRIHDALVFLASSCPGGIATELKEWKPTERDSSTTLEEKISVWNRYWTDTCPPG